MKLIDYTAWIVIFIIALVVDNTLIRFRPSVKLLDPVFVFLGKEFFILAIAIAITLTFIYFKKRDSIRFWLSLAVTIAVSYVIKILIQRPRPFLTYTIKPLVEPMFTFSFPSMTTAAIFAMLPFMLKNFKKERVVWWIIALVIAFSRLYVGVHFLSDIVFGAFAGYFIGDIFLRHSKKNPKK